LIKVLIVDDHALVRVGIRRLLEDYNYIKIVGEASSGEEAVQLARDTQPNIVLLDLWMPGIGGIETTKRLIRLRQSLRVIVLTACNEDPYPTHILNEGAFGYITKESGVAEMVKAIETVHRGKRYISSDIAQLIALRTVDDFSQDGSLLDQISSRELQVMTMITRGLKVQEIADQLHITTKTVNAYRYRLFEKLGVENDVMLTHLALRHGLLKESAILMDEQ